MEQSTIFKIAQNDGCCPYCLEAKVPKNAGVDQVVDIASNMHEGTFPIAYQGDYVFVCRKHHTPESETLLLKAYKEIIPLLEVIPEKKEKKKRSVRAKKPTK